MINTMTISLFVLASISFVFALIALVWLSMVSKHVLELGKKVLESEDIGRIIQAADKTVSFDSRMTVCENKADESKNQLEELQTKLNELEAKLEAAEQIMDSNKTDHARTSEKMTSFILRFDGFENNVGEKLNQLSVLKTKVDEIATNLKSVEAMVNNNRAGLDETDQSIKAAKEEIQRIEKFQTAIEKTHNLIRAAFTEKQASTLPGDRMRITPETAEPEEISQESEDEQEKAKAQETSEAGTYPYS